MVSASKKFLALGAKDNQAINDTQLEVSANEQGLHLELEIPWKRLPLMDYLGYESMRVG